jgi:hypothetical protein
MDFLESDWAANPMFLLKQVSSYGLVISFWNSSVGYQGIEPRYLRVHFIRTITPICSIPLHCSTLDIIIQTMQLLQHSPYQKTIPTRLQVGNRILLPYYNLFTIRTPLSFHPQDPNGVSSFNYSYTSPPPHNMLSSQTFNVLCNQNSLLVRHTPPNT